jgi:hypothetical protein
MVEGMDRWLTPDYFPWVWWWRAARQRLGWAVWLLRVGVVPAIVAGGLWVFWLATGH